jgi:N-acetylmuramoyl-L-alanine amidase
MRKEARRESLGCILGQLRLGLLAVAMAALVLTVYAVWYADRSFSSVGMATPGASAEARTPTRAPTKLPSPTRKGAPSPTSKMRRIGILAGHSGPQDDPGAVCQDGLREADINLAIAKKVQASLASKGYAVDLLEEFDDRLAGYEADAFLAIHADSCEIAEASGFKVAHVSFSAIPQTEDVLVECLYDEYERATGLPRHDFSITPDMHEYHAFLQIAPATPGAIIEMGFMAADRTILTTQQDELAAGIVSGLLCFLQN